jgi:hypothetical protein
MKAMNKIRKKTVFPIISAVAGVLVLIGAAGTPNPAGADSDKKAEQKVEETYRDVKEYSFEKKEDAVAWLKQRQTALEIKLKKLEAQAEKGGDKTKETWNKTIAALEKERAAAVQQMQKLSASTKSAWEDTKDGAVKAYRDLEMALDDAMKKL